MKRSLLMTVLPGFVLSCSLEARENPFVPSVDMQNLPKTTLDPNLKEQLEEFEFQLPEGAQILNSIEVTYQDASGEKKSKEYEVDKKIKWHYPLYLSHTPKEHYETKKYQPLDFLKIVHEGTNFKIHTPDKLIRMFHLIDPFKLVFDFEAKKSFLTKRRQMDKPAVAYAVGNHNGYYRVVIELDATYRYEYKRTDDGVSIELK